MTREYNKLVRDYIPDIIEDGGSIADVRTLTEPEYILFLDKKLNEEVKEYQESKSVEEIADIIEVLYAICDARGYSREQLECVRLKKLEEKGGFKEKVFLHGVRVS